ncbi:MAG TPA: hypothetical protein VEJ84_00040, partial [Acidimicrobiales bacterium]|nr:hypothetical protein [Acidimicrobiales bacterium]
DWLRSLTHSGYLYALWIGPHRNIDVKTTISGGNLLFTGTLDVSWNILASTTTRRLPHLPPPSMAGFWGGPY